MMVQLAAATDTRVGCKTCGLCGHASWASMPAAEKADLSLDHFWQQRERAVFSSWIRCWMIADDVAQLMAQHLTSSLRSLRGSDLSCWAE